MNDVLQTLKVESKHLRKVAELHMEAFPESALTKLGNEAVRRYYEWQLIGPHDHQFIGAFVAGRLKAFAVGGKSRGALSGFIRREKYFLAVKILLNTGVFFTEHGRKAFRTTFRILTGSVAKAHPAPMPNNGQKSFGVLAIAVSPACRRKGFGRVLMEELDRAAVASGHVKMHLTVHPNNVHSVQFYERLGWTKLRDGATWEGRMEKQLNAHRCLPTSPTNEQHG